MKKYLFIFMAAILLLTGCASNNASYKDDKHEQKTIKVAALKGPTSMGLVKLFKDSDEGNSYDKYEYTILNSPEEVVAGLSKGEFDIAARPSNLASILYNKSNGQMLKVLAINTGSVLNIASKDDSIKTLEDLKGRTIVTSGKGATPEFVMRFILEKNGIDPDSDVAFDFKSEHTEVVADIAKNPDHVALLPEPFLTVAKGKVEGLDTRISLGDEWSKIEGAGELITGVTVVTNKYLQTLESDDDKLSLERFLDHYNDSVDFANKKTADAAKIIGEMGIFPEDVATKAIPNCKIIFEDSDKMKEDLSKFYESLFSVNPKSIGGALPDEGFYYQR